MPVRDQQSPRHRYMLIPRVLIFIRRGSQILLIQGDPGKTLWAGKYNGLGGHLESGEDVFTAACRELWEEAGLAVDGVAYPADQTPAGRVTNFRLCGTLVVDTGDNPGIGIYIFTGDCIEGEGRASAEGLLHWVEIDEISALPCVEDLTLLVRRLQRMAASEPPFSARSHYEGDELVIEFHP